MTEKIQYYAIVGFDEDVDNPSGLARRTTDDDGYFKDESFRRDFTWGHTSAVVSWDRGEGDELVKVSAEEAERLMERFRQRWSDL